MRMGFTADETHFFSPAGEIEAGAPAALRASGNLELCDSTPLPRIGFKGRDARRWLEGFGCRLPEEPNRAARQDHGALAAALSWDEYLVLSDPDRASALCEELERAWELDARCLCYPVPRRHSHAWFRVGGACAPEMLAKLCGVDLRPEHFAGGRVAQTSVASLSAIVIRAEYGAPPTFHILVDSASAEYLWRCLADAMQEFRF